MNGNLLTARKILARNGYTAIRDHIIPQESRGDFHLQWWAGGKGVVILQSEAGVQGVHTYINWGHGATMDELEDAVKPDDRNG